MRKHRWPERPKTSNWHRQPGTSFTSKCFQSIIQSVGTLTGLILQKVTQVTCGWRHTVAITDRGNVYSWGRGTSGQLGHGETIDRYILLPVSKRCQTILSEWRDNFVLLVIQVRPEESRAFERRRSRLPKYWEFSIWEQCMYVFNSELVLSKNVLLANEVPGLIIVILSMQPLNGSHLPRDTQLYLTRRWVHSPTGFTKPTMWVLCLFYM